MTITRNIDGQDGLIALTDDELEHAYWLYRSKCIADDIGSVYNIPQNQVYDVVDEVINALDKNDTYWDSYWETLMSVCDSCRYEKIREV